MIWLHYKYGKNWYKETPLTGCLLKAASIALLVVKTLSMIYTTPRPSANWIGTGSTVPSSYKKYSWESFFNRINLIFVCILISGIEPTAALLSLVIVLFLPSAISSCPLSWPKFSFVMLLRTKCCKSVWCLSCLSTKKGSNVSWGRILTKAQFFGAKKV